MKKLSETWKQKRPRKGVQTPKPKVVNSSHEQFSSSTRGGSNCKGSKSLKDQEDEEEGSLDSLGFSSGWDFEASTTMNEIGLDFKTQPANPAMMKESKTKTLLSPPTRSTKKLSRGRISTPIETSNKKSPQLTDDIISPVFAANPIKVQNLDGVIKNSNQMFENVNLEDLAQGQQDINAAESVIAKTLSIDSWDLPSCVSEKYKTAGIKQIFQWQRDCLMTGKALNGGNLVYSAPTSAGKTLVAEMLMLKRVLSTKRKALYILPFVSVAREKMFCLQEMFKEAGVRVDGYMGAQVPAGGFAATDIAVCTIEKANSLVNRLMEDKKMSTLGVVVVDEMHMIGDGHRGYLLELMLTKIRFLQAVSSDDDDLENNGVQIIGMSATLPNLEMLASWLKADLYLTDFRPVPLVETMKVGKTVMDQNLQKISEINNKDIIRGDEEHIIPLCLETIRDCHSVLIFCPTKQWCEKLAKTIADNLKQYVVSDSKLPPDADFDKKFGANSRTGFLDAAAIAEVIEQLRRSPVGLDKALAEIVSSGVSFHHAGLTFDERDVIEGAFRRGAIRVLVATSTLSSGVNLPARRVILRTPIFHGKLIDPLVYKQMTGRAGRKGVDTKGESILICKTSEKQKGMKLLKSHLEPVYSCLMGSGTKEDTEIPGMKRALLEIIAAGVASTRVDVEKYAECTYLNTCLAAKQGFDATNSIKNTIQFLTDNEFIRVQRDGEEEDAAKSPSNDIMEKFTPTQLGSATLASALSPDEALVVFRELQKARRCFVLENELHIVYQVMPIYMQSQWPELDWYRYFNLFEKLPPQYKRVGEIVGVEEAFLARAIRGRIPTRTEEQRQKLAVHQRFYSALVLLELVNEIPLRTVSRRYNVNKGLLQSLQNSASTFAGMVTKFCQKLGWRNMEMLVDQFQSRLSFGVTRELCDLVRISLLNGARARLLYNAGYHSASAVATASVVDLTKLLENFAPFESHKTLQGETARELASKKRVRSFWVTGKDGMTESQAAALIIIEAKELVKNDLASLGVKLSDVQFMGNNELAALREQSVSAESTKEARKDVENKTRRENNAGKSTAVQNYLHTVEQKTRTLKRKSNSRADLGSLNKRRSPPPPPQELNTRSPLQSMNACNAPSSSKTAITENRRADKENVLVGTAQIANDGISALAKRLLSKRKSVEQFPKENYRPVASNASPDNEAGGSNQDDLTSTTRGAGLAEKEQPVDIADSDVNGISSTNIARDRNVSCMGSGTVEKHSIDTFDQSISLLADEPKFGPEYGPKYDTSEESISLLVDEPEYGPKCGPKNGPVEGLGARASDNGNPLLNDPIASTVTTDQISESCGFWSAVKGNGNSDSFEANEDNSLEEANGSLILISTNEDDSIENDEMDCKRDITPELFSEPLCRDSQLEMEIGREEEKGRGCEPDEGLKNIPVKEKSRNKTNALITEGTRNAERTCYVSTDVESDQNEGDNIVREKDSKSVTSCDNANPQGSIFNEELRNTDMNFDSFGGYDFSSPFNVTGEKHLDSFCLKLSESMTERFAVSPELIDQPPNDGENDSREVGLDLNEAVDLKEAVDLNENLHANEAVSPGLDVSRNKSKLLAERFDINNALGEDLLDLSDTRSRPEMILRRDSRGIRRGTTKGDDKTIYTQVKERIFGADPNNSEIIMSGSESFANALCDVEFLDPVPAQTVKRDSGGGKRRSSERIAMRNLNLGQSDKFSIVDVTNSKETFNAFMDEWRRKQAYSFSVAGLSQNGKRNGAGERNIAGISVCLGGKTVYFVDLQNAEISGSFRVKTVIEKVMLELVKDCPSVNKIIFDTKEHYKVLRKSFDVEIKGKISDPKVAAWLLNPSSNESTLQDLVLHHLSNDFKEIARKIGNTYDTGSIGLMSHSAASPRLRASIEAVMAYELMSVLEMRLASDGLLRCFRETEMPVILTLARMELNGIGFSAEKCETLKDILQGKLQQLEAKCKNLAGRHFSINAPEEVAQVLFIELGLPPSGDPEVLVAQKTGSKGHRSRVRHLSTAKGILEKLKEIHPLPMLILEWRKVNNALTKVVHPMQRAKELCFDTKLYRIFPHCQFHTVTGRVIIAEPGLQNVPKDFDINLTTEDCSSAHAVRHGNEQELATTAYVSRNSRVARTTSKVLPPVASDKLSSYGVSMRTAFIPSAGGILIAADYSQLELRIITHSIERPRFCPHSEQDGRFSEMLALKYNTMSADHVTEQQRTYQADCYGYNLRQSGKISLAASWIL
eukprot:Seg1644.12_Seg1644.13 transcript_id=Seg1644.12_Seg1644.13/GoldUCD/mRNA.D3Y31 product="DNA polymerase theta" protein_id=Seg1644.12_Seg1644.13/GoldUCD/D3Y31